MKVSTFLIFFLLASMVWSQSNVEIRGTYVKDNKNYIYLESETEKLKLKKKELTEEGVKAILANKETKLTLFVPPKSIVNRVEKPKSEGEEL